MKNNLVTLLFLLQLEEYDEHRTKNWLKNHDLKNLHEIKKTLNWTIKAKVLIITAVLFNSFINNQYEAVFWANKLINIPQRMLTFFIVLFAKIILIFHPKLIIIGITGSYGKTSVKEILNSILETKYRVLKTPENYNTPLGIAKTIIKSLRNQEILLVEMGAYRQGDIKTICDFVKPGIGIITNIGKQHLERFGSLEKIISTKSELFDSLPPEGFAVTNADNKFCLLAVKKLNIYNVLVSVNPKADYDNKIGNNLCAFNIETLISGSYFKLKIDGEVFHFKTKLLGIHNIRNILLAIAVARKMEIENQEIVKAVSNLSPIPHRLQIIQGNNSSIIIDDAYNASPDGSKAACDVLTSIHAPRKIVITPGLVELGSEQEKENEILGSEIAKCADYLLIVGKTNKNSLKRGYLSGRKTSTHNNNQTSHNEGLIECEDLNEATAKLQEIVLPKSIILFENDLPDQYI
jgi:UDP-N-acetylmuramoyl-tripeptide--D-alanyl-D-alanine ligase